MTRLYLPQPLAPQMELELPEDAVRHLIQVLRMQAGETLTVFNGQGGEYQAVLEHVDRRHARLRLGAHQAVNRESPLAVTLVQCVSKGERMDYTLQKAVELGVSRIVPLLSERSVVRLDAERWARRQAHWEGVVVAACQQSGRTLIPPVEPVADFSRWLAQPPPPGLRLTLAPDAPRSLRALPRPEAGVSLLVGPEGGLSAAEIRQAGAAGWQALRLGPRILRTETAGVALLAGLQALWGDWH
jgi:16S rRNA (uracil1498-N3)-methyltransferase